MTTSITYGLYSAGIAIVITLIEYFTGLDRSMSGRWIGFLGFVGLGVMMYLAIRERQREDYDGYITYGQSVGTGFMVALFSSIVLAIFMFVYLSRINPDMLDFMRQQVTDKFREQGVPAAQQEQAMKWVDISISPGGQAISTLLGGTFFGLIIALIMSIFTRSKDRPQMAM
jgi:hypothetical protein